MDRDAWLRERREVAERRFDTLHASDYDEHWGMISPSHRRFVADLVERCPPGGRILDAACGTGKYFPMILGAGRQVAGTDQSAGMLAQAQRKHPEVPTERVGLQDLAYDGAFDAAICVDAMENVGPEDWPTVLANLRRAVRPGGYVYLTVELPEDGQLARSFDAARARGAPVVWGEDAAEHGGYHFYPSRDQVAAWLDAAGLRVVREGAGDDYLHLVLQGDGA